MDDRLARVFSANLSRLLGEIGKSRYGLARDVGISESTLYDYAHGRSLPSVDTLIRISDALDITCDDLLRQRHT